jgi:hypothetical protein
VQRRREPGGCGAPLRSASCARCARITREDITDATATKRNGLSAQQPQQAAVLVTRGVHNHGEPTSDRARRWRTTCASMRSCSGGCTDLLTQGWTTKCGRPRGVRGRGCAGGSGGGVRDPPSTGSTLPQRESSRVLRPQSNHRCDVSLEFFPSFFNKYSTA